MAEISSSIQKIGIWSGLPISWKFIVVVAYLKLAIRQIILLTFASATIFAMFMTATIVAYVASDKPLSMTYDIVIDCKNTLGVYIDFIIAMICGSQILLALLTTKYELYLLARELCCERRGNLLKANRAILIWPEYGVYSVIYTADNAKLLHAPYGLGHSKIIMAS